MQKIKKFVNNFLLQTSLTMKDVYFWIILILAFTLVFRQVWVIMNYDPMKERIFQMSSDATIK